jgi:hypothetical protein
MVVFPVKAGDGNGAGPPATCVVSREKTTSSVNGTFSPAVNKEQQRHRNGSK